jgi:hypothetical protein
MRQLRAGWSTAALLLWGRNKHWRARARRGGRTVRGQFLLQDVLGEVLHIAGQHHGGQTHHAVEAGQLPCRHVFAVATEYAVSSFVVRSARMRIASGWKSTTNPSKSAR